MIGMQILNQHKIISIYREMCGTLAKDQNRCILTRKKHYNALSRTVDQGNCLAVKEDLPADQVNEVFSFFKGT